MKRSTSTSQLKMTTSYPPPPPIPETPKMKTRNPNRMSRAFVKVAAPIKRWTMAIPKEPEKTSSAAFVSGEWIFVSALNGIDPITHELSPLIEDQTEQTFFNIQAALAQSGASIKDIVRIRYILKDVTEWRDVQHVVRRCIGSVRPAQTVLQGVFLDENSRIEIEVTARKMGFMQEFAD